MAKQKILISADWFAPGFRGGGPIRSCVNFSYAMRDRYDIYVLTADRDLADEKPYPSVTQFNAWVTFDDNIQVNYLSPENQSLSFIQGEIEKVNPDFVYLNSMWSVHYTIKPLILFWQGKIKGKVVLAPRGMLHKGAMQYKGMKKKLFLALFKLLGVNKKLTYHATDEQERKDIRKWLTPGNAEITVVSNFPDSRQLPFSSSGKIKDDLKMIFISRIAAKKNLILALRVLDRLKGMEGEITFNIFGPIEEKDYWEECKNIINRLPANMKVNYQGEILPQNIQAEIHKHDLFVLPTFGENFGHAIFEAFLAGRPVLISDQSPWNNLKEKNRGWDIPLEREPEYSDAIKKAVTSDQTEWNTKCKAAWEFADQFKKQTRTKEEYHKIFIARP